MIWAILQVGGRQLTSLLVFAILGVLLAPRDFGLVGMAMAWLSIIQSFSDLGLGAALVQRREIGLCALQHRVPAQRRCRRRRSRWSAWLLAWPGAWFFHEPALQPVASALSLNFLLASLSAAQTAVAQRELRFRQLAIRDIAASVIGGGAGIAAGAVRLGRLEPGAAVADHQLGRGHPDLAAVALAAARGRVLGALLREMWPYSSQLFMFNVFKAFVQNLDRLLLGHLLGPVAVGLYVFAYRLVVQPIARVAGAVGTYLFPFLSRQQDNRRVSVGLRRRHAGPRRGDPARRRPGRRRGAGAGPDAVGQRWRAAVPLIQIMGLLAVLPGVRLAGGPAAQVARPAALAAVVVGRDHRRGRPAAGVGVRAGGERRGLGDHRRLRAGRAGDHALGRAPDPLRRAGPVAHLRQPLVAAVVMVARPLAVTGRSRPARAGGAAT